MSDLEKDTGLVSNLAYCEDLVDYNKKQYSVPAGKNKK
jgi:hypothetical protein